MFLIFRYFARACLIQSLTTVIMEFYTFVVLLTFKQ